MKKVLGLMLMIVTLSFTGCFTLEAVKIGWEPKKSQTPDVTEDANYVPSDVQE